MTIPLSGQGIASRQSNVSALPVSYVAADIRTLPWSHGLEVSTWGVGHVWSDCVPWARGLLLGHRPSRPLCVFVCLCVCVVGIERDVNPGRWCASTAGRLSSPRVYN